MDNLFVYLEIENETVEEVSLELLTKGRLLANQLNCQLEAVAIGNQLDKIREQVFPYGVDKLHIFDNKHLYPYTSLPHTSILVKLFKEENPQIALMGATNVGRDLGPRVSSSLFSGLTADCTSLEIGDHEEKREGKTYKNLLYQIRPAFGGNVVATIINPKNRPQMATVREGVTKKKIFNIHHKGITVFHEVDNYVSKSDFVIQVVERHIESSKVSIRNAPIIIAGGYGMDSKGNFELLYQLANTIGGEVGASRAAVDAGFAEYERQLGQTGLTVRPKVYFAFGISGQIQHITGIKDSSIIVSINNDPNAPINTIADYVIIGNVEVVIPKMIQYYSKECQNKSIDISRP